MKFQDWKQLRLGHRIDFDKEFDYQCVDLIRDYTVNVFGKNYPTSGNAKELWYRNWGADYIKYKNTPTFLPKVGDIVIWGNGTYGHIAVVTKASLSRFTVLEQNAGNGNGDGLGENTIREHSYNYTNVLGFIRNKYFSYEIITKTPWEQFISNPNRDLFDLARVINSAEKQTLTTKYIDNKHYLYNEDYRWSLDSALNPKKEDLKEIRKKFIEQVKEESKEVIKTYEYNQAEFRKGTHKSVMNCSLYVLMGLFSDMFDIKITKQDRIALNISYNILKSKGPKTAFRVLRPFILDKYKIALDLKSTLITKEYWLKIINKQTTTISHSNPKTMLSDITDNGIINKVHPKGQKGSHIFRIKKIGDGMYETINNYYGIKELKNFQRYRISLKQLKANLASGAYLGKCYYLTEK